MVREMKVAAAQIGAVDAETPVKDVINRMIKLLNEAHTQGVELVNYPELTFTTFFPRHLIPFGPDLDKYFMTGDITNNDSLKPFFSLAKQHKIAVCVGYAELTEDGDHFNSCITVGKDGKVLQKYRKTHVPGDLEPVDGINVQSLEKRYFKPGNLGFPAFRLPETAVETVEEGEPVVGMLVCNDRRWPEAWRSYGLQGVDIILVGYNTPKKAAERDGVAMQKVFSDSEADDSAIKEGMAIKHNNLCICYNSYVNCTYTISSARAGYDDGKYGLIGASSIVNPWGDIIASAETDKDELVVADIDLDLCLGTRKRLFNFARHRVPERYGLLVEQRGVIKPPSLTHPHTP